MAWLLDREVKRELPAEWNDVVPTEVFVREAKRIVEEANKKRITLRIMGGLGIAIRCLDFREFATKLGRLGTGVARGQEYSDIDFMSYARDRDDVKAFFGEIGYAKRSATLSSAASERQIYYHPKGWFYVQALSNSAEPLSNSAEPTIGTATAHANAEQRLQRLHNRLHSQSPQTPERTL